MNGKCGESSQKNLHKDVPKSNRKNVKKWRQLPELITTKIAELKGEIKNECCQEDRKCKSSFEIKVNVLIRSGY